MSSGTRHVMGGLINMGGVVLHCYLSPSRIPPNKASDPTVGWPGALLRRKVIGGYKHPPLQ